MRVAVVGPGPRFLSGISYATWRLSASLQATPILFRYMLPGMLFPGRERVGLVEHRIRYDNAHEILDWYNPLTWMRSVREVNRHDVVILEWWTASVAHMYAFLVLFSRTPVFVEMHEIVDTLEDRNMLIRWYARAMRKFILAYARGIVVHSRTDREKLPEYGNVVVIPLGLFDYYTPIGVPKTGSFNVLFFGLVREYKGVPDLIEGFRKADIPGSSLRIAGENWDRIDLGEGVLHDDRYLNDEETEEAFSWADVVVLPYLRASQSGVAHIAMHFGLPVIATDVGGLSELADYQGMHYVPVHDSDAIARELRQISSDERGKRYPAPARLSWEHIALEWRNMFDGRRIPG